MPANQPMTDDEPETMRELYEEEGYDPDELQNPRDVDADDLTDDSVVVAYTAVRNPDPDAPATMYAVTEFDIEAVVPTEDVAEYTDGDVSYPDDTPVTHGVHFAYKHGNVAEFASIGCGEAMYGEDPEFSDPNRWERPVTRVRGVSDTFVRIRV